MSKNKDDWMKFKGVHYQNVVCDYPNKESSDNIWSKATDLLVELENKKETNSEGYKNLKKWIDSIVYLLGK